MENLFVGAKYFYVVLFGILFHESVPFLYCTKYVHVYS